MTFLNGALAKLKRAELPEGWVVTKIVGQLLIAPEHRQWGLALKTRGGLYRFKSTSHLMSYIQTVNVNEVVAAVEKKAAMIEADEKEKADGRVDR
jgi:hypothetical protein